ncbi:MAG: hypothetical protein BGP13_09905 [Sphingobacteriales bacterium 40-81]|nr:MAG: hypothetical protein BGP13_09905 [Sphingobacteriales bacterium 40-81]
MLAMEFLSSLTRIQVHGIYLLIAGLAIRFIVGRRRFNRRGIGGLQHFNSYIIALIVMTVEWLFNLAALLAIVIGVVMLIA